MLLELQIRNIALIDQLRIPFFPGLNILTGETGAGKSIVVDSVSLAMGGRADRELIRSGASSASVQAAFDVSDVPQAQTLLASYGIEPGGPVVTVARELSANGHNICRICGNAVSLSQLRGLTALLMDMHGQHEHQKLMDPSAQLEFLDAAGGEEHLRAVEALHGAWEAYDAAKTALRNAESDIRERERMMDMLRYQIADIDEVRPKPGELSKLEAKARLYAHSEVIAEKIDSAYTLAYSGTGRAGGAQSALKKAADAMASIAEFDDRFAAIRSRLEESYYTVQEIGLELQDLHETLDRDPARLSRIEDRIDSLRRLLRKYGPSEEDAIAFRADAASRLEELENADARREELETALRKAEERYADACADVSERRRAIADEFCARVRSELSELGMPKVRFEARFTPRSAAQRGPQGADDIEFVISPNPGEPLKPMATIASGGELARIMLAFRTVQNDRDGVGTVIFDEIDTGVSGRMAQAVGEKMARIAFRRQVLCVTHLPQIAALGDCQFLVEKQEQDGRTQTDVRLLDDAGRAQELARLVGGAAGSESAVPHAVSLLEQAALRKKELRAE